MHYRHHHAVVTVTTTSINIDIVINIDIACVVNIINVTVVVKIVILGITLAIPPAMVVLPGDLPAWHSAATQFQEGAMVETRDLHLSRSCKQYVHSSSEIMAVG